MTSTHSIDSSDQMAWGNGAISASANYGTVMPAALRLLPRPARKRQLPDPAADPDATSGAASPGVTIADAATKVYTTNNYWQVEDVNAPGFIANISAWCATCHTRYLASAESATTDSGDAVYAYRHRSDQTSQGSASCIQCHVSHGSNASMGTYSAGVSNPDGTSAGADSRLLRIDNRGVCQMCHTDK